MMLILTYIGEVWGELTWTALLGQVWSFPLLVAMVALNLATINKWVLYAILVLLLSYPNGKPDSRLIKSHRLRADALPRSPPDSGWLELAELQRRAVKDSLSCLLQHVRPGGRYHRQQHLPGR